MTSPAPRRTPTYAPHLRVLAAGQLGPAGSAWEIFSYSFSVAPASGGVVITPSVLADMANDLKTFHARPGSLIDANARLTSVKIAQIEPDGKWTNGKALYEETCDVGGGSTDDGNLYNAPQVALAVTLRTALNTPRARGRFYLPCPTIRVPASTGTIADVTANQVGQSVATLLRAINNQPGIDGNDQGVVVASTFGQNHKVTGLSVGRVLDTIRSRRNALREAYVSVAL